MIKVNPFESSLYQKEETLTYFILNQVKETDVGQSLEIDTGGEEIRKLRAIIQHVQSKLGYKFKTKTDNMGGLWLKRVS